MADPVPPRNQLGPLVDTLRDYDRRLRSLEKPTGTQSFGSIEHIQRTLDYLASLQLNASYAASYLTGTVPNDGVTRWFFPPAWPELTIPIPTGMAVITASAGEASVTPGGSYVIAHVSFKIVDSTGAVIRDVQNQNGRFYTNQRQGVGVTTYGVATVFDTEEYPGPYTVSGAVGLWASGDNTTACEAVFNTLTLNVQIVGNGVPEA